MKVIVTQLKCSRCAHEWIARRPQAPKVCPNCKRPDWSRPKHSGNGLRKAI